jgi:hypothetical protein
MKMWLIGGAVVVLLGASLILAALKRTASASAVPAECLAVVVESAPVPASPAPVALPQVVDVVDIDALLDPPAIPPSDSPAAAGPSLIRVGYEEPAAAAPPTSPVKPIPPAASHDGD